MCEKAEQEKDLECISRKKSLPKLSCGGERETRWGWQAVFSPSLEEVVGRPRMRKENGMGDDPFPKQRPHPWPQVEAGHQDDRPLGGHGLGIRVPGSQCQLWHQVAGHP